MRSMSKRDYYEVLGIERNAELAGRDPDSLAARLLELEDAETALRVQLESAISTETLAIPSAGQPVEFSKWVLFMPINAAFWFMTSTNASSLPETYSANATVASLPDCTITPSNKSLTDT